MTEAVKPELAKILQLASNPPPELVSLAESLLVTMAMHQLKAEAVDAYATEVLASMQAKIATKWVELGVPDQLILKPKDAFLLDDEQATRYHALCEEKRVASGMTVNRPGNCPALEAEELFRTARDAFIEALAPFTGITLAQVRFGALHDKLMDWGLRLLSKHVDPHARFGIPKAA